MFEGGESDDDDQVSYLDLVRETGAGPLRIGQQISLRSDIYSMLFAGCFSSEFVLYHA